MRKRIALMALLGLFVASTASAHLVPYLQSVSGVPGAYVFSYGLDITGTQRMQEGEIALFTIYDIPNIVSVAAPNSDWAASIQNPGVTPTLTNPVDGSLPNVTFTYSGDTVVGDSQVGIPDIYGFLITVSHYDYVELLGNYASQATQHNGPLAGTATTNGGYVQAPAIVPEPATLSLLAVGGGLLGLLRRRRKA